MLKNDDINVLTSMNFEDMNQEQWDATDDYLIHIDHRDEEDGLIDYIGKFTNTDLKSHWEEDQLFTILESKKHHIPLTITPHDRYVAISSVALLLKEKFTFWLVSASLEDDTHSLLIIENQLNDDFTSKHSKWIEKNLTQLKLGFDYFHQINIPYINNLKNNPNFETDAELLQDEKKALFAALENTLINDKNFQKSMADMKTKLGTQTTKPKVNIGIYYAGWIGALVLMTMFFSNLDI